MTKTALKDDQPYRKPEVVKLPVMSRTHFIEAEHAVRTWCATLDPGVPYETALESRFWVPVANQMHLNDDIKLRNSEGTLFAWLLVVSCDPSRNFVEVVELLKKDLTPMDCEPYIHGDLVGRWEGPVHRWCVRRLADNIVLGRGIPNRPELVRQMHADFVPMAAH